MRKHRLLKDEHVYNLSSRELTFDNTGSKNSGYCFLVVYYTSDLVQTYLVQNREFYSMLPMQRACAVIEFKTLYFYP